MQRDNQIKFYILRESYPHEINRALSLVYVLKGQLEIMINQVSYTVHAGGLFSILPFSPYRIANASDENVGIEIRIEYDYLEACGWRAHIRLPYVLCDNDGEEKTDEIRSLFAECYQQSTYGDDMSVMLSVQHLLLRLQERIQEEGKSIDAQMKHVDHVLNYIWMHWKEDINTEELAEKEFVSASHMRQLFKRWMNTSIITYTSEVRLYHAHQELVNSNASITTLALEHGFKNTNLFISAFKEKYGCTPAKFRKINKVVPRERVHAYDFSSLLQYLHGDEHIVSETVTEIQLSAMQTNGTLFSDSWKSVMSVDFARNLLLEPVQRQIRYIQERIGFRYIHFHGIFDNAMYIYDEDEQGSPRYSFFYVDWVFDFLKEVNLKPYLDFGNMPYKLAKNTKYRYIGNSWSSIYNSKEKWENLIRKTLEHLIDRYGIDEVRTWLFVTFPLLPNEAKEYGIISERDYFELYETTWSAVKSVDRKLKFGGPGSFSHDIWNGKLLQKFLDYTHRRGCVPDFYTFRGYANQQVIFNDEFSINTVSQFAEPVIPSPDTKYTQHFLNEWKKLAGKYGDAERDVWLEEWNVTLWQRDPANDTAFKAVWFIKNVCESHNLTKGFGYWMTLDFNEEHSLQIPGEFHGGLGALTLSGIPKSLWNAFELLNQVKGMVIDQGENWIAVRNEESLQILLYHYSHYNSFLLRRSQIYVNRENTYQLFAKKENAVFSISINHCYGEQFCVSQTILNRQFGSSFDRWVCMGAPEPLTEEERNILREEAHPLTKTHIMTPENRQLILRCELEPHEVQLWTVKKIR